MKTIKFELGSCDPRNLKFDHHSGISHSNSFVAKMASVQLIEWWWANGCPDQIKLTFNHIGHIDDIVAHAVVMLAKDKNIAKMRSLYRFACQVSVLDSCGRLFNDLLDADTLQLLKDCYNVYHAEANAISTALNIGSSYLPVQKGVPAIKKAAKFLITSLPDLNGIRTEETVVPDPESFVLEGHENIALITAIDNRVNLYTHCNYFFEAFSCIVFVTMPQPDNIRYLYSILLKSPYHGDLVPVWDYLNKEDDVPTLYTGWGGHSGAGGSSRKQNTWLGGSSLEPYFVLNAIQRFGGIRG